MVARIDFGEGDAAGRHFRLAETECTRYRQRQSLETGDETSTLRLTQRRRLAIRRQIGLRQERVAQSPR